MNENDAAYIRQKQEERNKYYRELSDAMDKMAADPALFRTYLEVQGRVSDFSVGNAIMVARQFPAARNVRLLSTWASLNMKPIARAQAISVLVPGEKYRGVNGTEVQSYTVCKAYDISQVSGGNYEAPPKPEDRALLQELLDYQKGAWERRITTDGEPARYDPEKNALFIRRSQIVDQLYPILARETVCADLALRHDLQRDEAEPIAVCTAWMLCARYDKPTGGLELPKPEEVMGTDRGKYRSRLGALAEELRTILGFSAGAVVKTPPQQKQELSL